MILCITTSYVPAGARAACLSRLRSAPRWAPVRSEILLSTLHPVNDGNQVEVLVEDNENRRFEADAIRTRSQASAE
jgi:hypothetical protein